VIAGRRSPEDDRFPLNRRALEGARGVVVHSRWARDRVAEKFPRLPIRVILPGIPTPAAIPREEARRALGIPGNAFLVIAPGRVDERKRIPTCLEGFARFAASHPEALFRCVGECEGPVGKEVGLAAERTGVADRFRITGNVSNEDYERNMAAADACLVLRRPYGGETSSSLLRAMSHGLPCIVHDIGAFGEIEEGAVARIPADGHEPERISGILERWAGDGGERDTVACRARALVRERYSVEQAAEAYARFAAEIAAESDVRDLARETLRADPPPDVAELAESLASSWGALGTLRVPSGAGHPASRHE
jgi:glycosyltransferase involved in cell wall biosynthesis